MGRVWMYGRYMNMYERPCRRRNRDRTPRTGTGPAWAHMTSGDRATVHKPSTPATARRTTRTQPQKHTRILCVPTAICAMRSGHTVDVPPARLQQPPCASHMLADWRSRRPPDLAAAAAPAVHVALLCSRSQPSRSGHDHRRRAPARILKQGTVTIRRPTRRLFAGSAHTGLGAQGECSGGGSG